MGTFPSRPLATCALVVAGCTELTNIGPERLPPEQPEVIDEGTLVETTADTCASLEVGPPIRLAATPSDSGSIDMVASRLAGITFIGLAWLEFDDEGAPTDAMVRFLLEDGSQYGEVFSTSLEGVHDPGSDDGRFASIAIFPMNSPPGFATALAGSAGTIVSLVRLERLGAVWPDPELTLPLIEGLWSARGVAVDNRLWIAALDPDYRVVLQNIVLRQEAPPLLEQLEVAPSGLAVEVVPSSDGVRLLWLENGTVYSARAWRDDDDELAVSETVYADEVSASGSSRLRAATLGERVLVPVVSNEGQGEIIEPGDDDSWRSMGVFEGGEPDWRDPSIAIEGSGVRWAIVQVDTSSREEGDVVLRRGHVSPVGAGRVACSRQTECVSVTTDFVPSHEPSVVRLPNGYGVAWTDEVDGQRDVFFARLGCRPWTRSQ